MSLSFGTFISTGLSYLMDTYLLHPCAAPGSRALRLDYLRLSIGRQCFYTIYVQHFNAIPPPLLPQRGTGQHPSGHIARHPIDGAHFLKTLRYRMVSVCLAPDALWLSSSQVTVPVPMATLKVQEHGGGMHQRLSKVARRVIKRVPIGIAGLSDTDGRSAGFLSWKL